MTMTRRSMLQSLLIAPSALMALRPQAVAAGTGRPLMLVFHELGPDMKAQTFDALLAPFRERTLKLAVSVAPDQASAIAGSICRMAEEPFVEWVVDVPDLSPDLAYFQMRAASEAQRQFMRLLSSCGSATGRSASLTLTCRAPKSADSGFDGVRAAGFRNVLLQPEQDAGFDHWSTDNGVLQLQGGVRFEFTRLDRAMAAISEGDEDAEPLLAYMSLKDLSRLDDAEVSAMAGSLADVLAARAVSGDVELTLPREFHSVATKPSRFIGLHFDFAQGAAMTDAAEAALAAAGIVFSYSGDKAAVRMPSGSGAGSAGDAAFCPALGERGQGFDSSDLKTMMSEDLLGGSGRFAAPQSCAIAASASSDLARAIGDTGFAVVTSLAGDASDIEGLDNAGLFHMPASAVFSSGDRQPDPAIIAGGMQRSADRLRDVLIVVRPEPGGEPISEPLRSALETLAKDRSNVFVGLPGMASGMMPSDPIFDLLKRARAQDFLDGAPIASLDAGEKAELERDAELAWRYFERLSDPRSGLAVSTAQLVNGGTDSYPIVTMWDVGSQILATTSARIIGLIGDGEFFRRIGSILKSLPVTKIRGMALPQSQVSAVQPSYRDGDFNASDTGRLLLALKVLETRFGMAKEVSRIVARWNLDKIILDRRLQNVEKGRFDEYFDSNYVEYAARGYALWGLETENPYPLEAGVTGTDRDMRLLYRASDLGPIATEPHVLEEIEIGCSEVSRLIAKVLYAAQVSGYESTGKFYCVSEISIAREPWFLYHGFELGAERNPWRQETFSDEPRSAGSEFGASTGIISTKGAFMWAAARPGPYSRKLLAYVRDKARIPDLGFSAGVPMEPNKPVEAYSDSNTNGIILEAIDYALAGRRPLLASD